MVSILIRSRWLLTGRPHVPAIEDGAVVIEDGIIRAVGKYPSLADMGPFQQQFGDPSRHVVLPGFINGHHHATRPTQLGMTPGPLETWLLKINARPLPPLSDEESYDHTLWGALQMLKGGVTTVLDHHTGDPGLHGSDLEPSIRAYLASGIRAVFTIGCADQQRYVYAPDAEFIKSVPEKLKQQLLDGQDPFDADAFFRMWEQMANAYNGRDDRMWVGFAPAGPEWCSEPLLRRMSQLAREHDAPIQIHLGETRYQLQYALKTWGYTPVNYLHRIGFLNRRVSCAHGIWTTAEDWRVLAETGAAVVHNPASNLLLASGIAPIAEMLTAGVTVGFGLDATGFSDAMDYLPDLRLAWLLQRRPGVSTPRPSVEEMLAIATSQGARSLSLDTALGSLEQGKQADLLLVDSHRLYDSPYVHPQVAVEDVLLRRGTGSDVEAVMVKGEWVIWNHRYLPSDEEALKQRMAASVERFFDPAVAPSLADELEPHVAAFFGAWDHEELVPPGYRFNTR